MSDYPTRPQTPQAMLHRLPDKPDASSEAIKPSKYIILIMASTSVAGKVQIAQSVASALSCPLFQGDSMHETCAKAAGIGVSKSTELNSHQTTRNEGRYQRMWLSKMTRTGLLFPEESRAATEGFSGFGGSLSPSTSRRGSTSSIASFSSDAGDSVSSFAGSLASSSEFPVKKAAYINKPPQLAFSENQLARKANPALLVITHPELEKWHKDSIRNSVAEYGIGVIFVPLYEDELPILKPLDPRTMTSFGAIGSFGGGNDASSVDEEIVLSVNVNGKVEELIEEIVESAVDIMKG